MGVHTVDDEAVDRIDNRVPLLVMDQDKRDAYVHFLALAPQGLNVEQAREALGKCFREVVEADPEEWDYGQLDDRLNEEGWETRDVAVWEENRDG